MSVPASHWARGAAAVFRANGQAADFVTTPAAGGSTTTYADCKSYTRSATRVDEVGAVYHQPATFVHVPRLDGATRPAENDFGAYDGGDGFIIGAVAPKSGIWVVESRAL